MAITPNRDGWWAFMETGHAMTDETRNVRVYELASIPSGQTQRIEGFIQGANSLLRQLWNSGMEDMEINFENRNSGNTHIYLETFPPQLLEKLQN